MANVTDTTATPFSSASAPAPALAASAGTVWINEIHYDNDGADAGEAIEIAGPAGTDLADHQLVLYNGNGGTVYGTVVLSGTIPDQENGFGTLGFDVAGLQNGAPDGVALVDPGGSVLRFLSYEGSFTASDGPAAGMESTDIGVAEGGSTPEGFSLQLTGTGAGPADFDWQAPSTASFGDVNDGQGFDGTIEPPPPAPEVAIHDIQGAGHLSPYEGQVVATAGIVTAVGANGFYLQDPEGDGDDATSEAIFVFTGSAAAVAVGDALDIQGLVAEFVPGGAATGNLSTTELVDASFTVTSSGNALPAATILGADGRLPPTETIDDDDLATFDPESDGIDFYESLEGMRVTVDSPVAVGPTNDFGEIYTVVESGDGTLNATSLSDRGTVNIEGGEGALGVTNTGAGADFNPERIQIDDDGGLVPGFSSPDVDVGARLTSVTGVVDYNFGNYEVRATEAFAVRRSSGLQEEETALQGGDEELLVATYNVLNLDPNDADGDTDVADGRFEAVANDIVFGLNTPDVVALQEIQDNDGGVQSDIVAADDTLQLLVDEIEEASGIRYEYIDNPFITDEASGGQPGANIRTAFLYNPERVDFVEGSLDTVVDPATQPTDTDNPFFDARLPLVATFTFNNEAVTLIDNHFASKGGSSPLFGAEQPPVNGGAEQRAAQAQAVNDYVDALLAADADARAIVLGDLNEFEFEEPLQVLEGDLVVTEYDVADEDPETANPADATATVEEAPDGGTVLNNLTFLLGEDERYSYVFEGNSQSLDHIMVTDSLLEGAAFDAVHLNAEFAGGASDHDPLVARLTVPRGPIEATPGSDRFAFEPGFGEVTIEGFDVDGGGEETFDTLAFTFDDRDFELSETDDFLEFVALIESDGDSDTDAVLRGRDVVLDFGNGDAIRLDGIVGNDLPEILLLYRGIEVQDAPLIA